MRVGAPTLVSDLAPQDLHGGLDIKDELAAQSWTRLSARDDQLAAQASLGAPTLMSDLAAQDLLGRLATKQG